MTELQRGDRVKVTFEGVYAEPSNVVIGGHFILTDERPVHVSGHEAVTIEVIKPEVKEPQAFGALVEVDGVKYTRADEDTYRWRGNDGSWEDWDTLKSKGEITVLFDPDERPQAATDPHPALRDEEDDIWRWAEIGREGPGYYCVPKRWDDAEEPLYKASREAVNAAYGPVTEVA